MDEKPNKTKFYVTLFIVGMVLVSLGTAYKMSLHLGEDESKERFRLTKRYKTLKKAEYTADLEVGKRLYENHCAKCHRANGAGSMTAPPLAGSDIVLNHQAKLLKIIVKGFKGKIERNGREYNSIMPSFKAFKSEDLAHVVNYIKTNFGNSAEQAIHPVEFNKMKIDTLGRKKMYEEHEL